MKWMKRESGFTLIELLIVVGIMVVLAVVGVSNFMFSLKKSHDVTRKSDLATIAKALEAFASDWGDYPADDSAGKIVGCDTNWQGLTSCTWGGSFKAYFPPDAADADKRLVTYLNELPTDPDSSQTYYYDKTTDGFDLFALLENTADPNVKAGLSVSCGSTNCNYQLSQSGVQ